MTKIIARGPWFQIFSLLLSLLPKPSLPKSYVHASQVRKILLRGNLYVLRSCLSRFSTLGPCSPSSTLSNVLYITIKYIELKGERAPGSKRCWFVFMTVNENPTQSIVLQNVPKRRDEGKSLIIRYAVQNSDKDGGYRKD